MRYLRIVMEPLVSRTALNATRCISMYFSILLEDESTTLKEQSRDVINVITVRPLLSAELDYPRFLRPNLSTPKLYEIQ